MMKKIFRLSLLAVAAAVLCQACCGTCCTEEYVAQDPAQINSIEDLQAYFTYHPDRDIIISAHRGGMMPGYPENCTASCDTSYTLGIEFYEVDFSFSKDSIMVMMHDLTIDRTTNGKGKVCDYTYEELQQFNLVDRDGNVTPYKIQTLKEVLDWGKNKVVFNFDNKYMNSKGVTEQQKIDALNFYVKQLQPGGEWAEYNNIMLSVRSIEEALFYWNKGIRNVMFCVEISSPEAYEAYDACPIPWNYIMAYIRLNVNPELQDVYNKLHDNGVMTMTSITGSSDKIKREGDRRIAYYRDLLSEPDIIETDYPSEFVGLPWSRAEIRAVQDAAIAGSRDRR